jgi:hypothetical protein
MKLNETNINAISVVYFNRSFARDTDVIFCGATDVQKGISHSHSIHALWDLITTRSFEIGNMSSGPSLFSLAPHPESLSQPAPVTLAATINLCSTICETGLTQRTH